MPSSTTTHTKPTADDIESRYRLINKKPAGDQAKRLDVLRESITDAAKVIVELTPPCSEQVRALDALDAAMLLGMAAIVRNEVR